MAKEVTRTYFLECNCGAKTLVTVNYSPSIDTLVHLQAVAKEMGWMAAVSNCTKEPNDLCPKCYENRI